VQMLAVTAHELRNPTAVIDGSAGALRRSWDEMSVAQRNTLLAGIRSSAERLRRLAGDLASAARADGETLPFRLEEVSLTEVVQGAASRIQASRPGARLEVKIPEDVVLRADPGRLAQLLDNLLDNAVRHGSPPIGLGVTADEDVSIMVTDGGDGIPLDLEGRLFERFALSGPAGGTGLGLYLVREIARRHGGDATYLPPTDARPSTFEVRLPR
jgi:signal transduction histidine kinase